MMNLDFSRDERGGAPKAWKKITDTLHEVPYPALMAIWNTLLDTPAWIDPHEAGCGVEFSRFDNMGPPLPATSELIVASSEAKTVWAVLRRTTLPDHQVSSDGKTTMVFDEARAGLSFSRETIQVLFHAHTCDKI
ncbi:hypothetical protein D9756_005380 [Leucocoprinus leucothites]|uniref:Uncharacterized protein n=1 Tax=Leucocoprinus leucothites TaxID=201217 RepID=A0A8H5FZI2_9AGAR|nr:hypothetical protein D9756_005380 [Leucoagaricus leucothites]